MKRQKFQSNICIVPNDLGTILPKIATFQLHLRPKFGYYFGYTVKLQTPDHLETVILTKTPGICWSEI
jgi:hypothetical protein